MKNCTLFHSLLLVIISVLCCSFYQTAHASQKADFYVATSGDDSWSGTLPEANKNVTDGPFATLHRARDALRELKARGGRHGSYVVMVRGGTYYLQEPLVLDPEDSGTAAHPVIYRPYPGEEVTLSGGRPITSWRKGDGPLWIAELPEVTAGKKAFERSAPDNGLFFRQLFVGGERQIRARMPNHEPDYPATGGWFFLDSFDKKHDSEGAFGRTLTRIHNPGDTFQWKIPVPADGTYALWFYYAAQNELFGTDSMLRIFSGALEGTFSIFGPVLKHPAVRGLIAFLFLLSVLLVIYGFHPGSSRFATGVMKKVFLSFGLIFAVGGLLCNPWILASIFSQDNSFNSQTSQLIWASEITLILFGLIVIKYRAQRKLCALLLGGFFALMFSGYFAAYFFITNETFAAGSKSAGEPPDSKSLYQYMSGRTTVRVDDSPPVVLQNLPDTGGWNTFKWARVATLKLTKGERLLCWTNVHGGGIDLDAFALCSDPDWKPDGENLPRPALRSELLLFHAEAFQGSTADEFTITRGPGKYPKNKFRFKTGDITPWPSSPEPEIHIFPAYGWVNAILSLDRVDHDRRIVYVNNRNCSEELWTGNRYFVENVFEALDSPGEWYLDRRKGRLYYWPEDAHFAGKGVVAPVLDYIIDMRGDLPEQSEITSEPLKDPYQIQKEKRPRFVEHIVIQGFSFRHTQYSLEMNSVFASNDATILMRRARHCVIKNCNFSGVGGHAVRLSDLSNNNRILDNTVVEAGQGGIRLEGPTVTQPKGNIIAGNYIRHCGKVWKHVAGVYVTTGSHNLISHNTITDMPRYGITLKSNGPSAASHHNIVEYNRLLRTNLETWEAGAIETLGRDKEDSGNVIRHNLILDSVGLKTSSSGQILTPSGGAGIMLDDYSSGTQVYGNIVARTGSFGLTLNSGRNNLFENNIFVDGEVDQIHFIGQGIAAGNKFNGNIVYYHTGALYHISPWSEGFLTECDRNLYWKAGENRSGSQDYITPQGSLSEWQKAGYDRNSIAADPLFVDIANDDYSLLPESPAFKLGFKPIDVSKMGVASYCE